MKLEKSKESSTESKSENSKKPSGEENYSQDYTARPETALINVALDETGTFRICTTPDCAKETANVLRRLSERERELWCRRFTPSCVEKILRAESVDEETKTFYREVERKIKEQ